MREHIDRIDLQVLELLSERALLANKIGHMKRKRKEAVYRPDREKEVYANLKAYLAKREPQSPQLSLASLQRIYREIMSSAISLEGRPVVAYLGPAASFSHVALQERFGDALHARAQSSIADVFRIVEDGQADYGLVPIDNSTQGSIPISLDKLLESSLKIYAEHYLLVKHHLLFYKKSRLSAVRRVYSMPAAQEQCREWLDKHLLLKKVEFIEVASTALAASLASKNKDGAAIASELAAQSYGLELIARNIHDKATNYTRFFLLGKEECAPTQDDKTSLVFALADRPGSLASVLQLFADSRINLTKIESRMRRDTMGGYHFFVDFLGHYQDTHIIPILKKMRRQVSYVKLLGSYPRLDNPVESGIRA